MKQSEKRKIILHCGAPKTGSTSLQFFLADNRDALARDGTVFPVRFISRGDVDPIHPLFVQMRADQGADRALLEARQRLDTLFEGGRFHTVLISNESLLGEPFYQGDRGFFPRRAGAIEMLKRFTEGYDVEVIYFVRDFESYLPSYYVQDVRRGSYASFKSYCRNVDAGALSWVPVIEDLKRAFGANRVRVFEHEALVQAPAETCMAAFGALLPSLPPFDGQNYYQNKSVGGWVLDLYRLVNWVFLKTVPDASQQNARRWVRRFVFKRLSRIASKRKKRPPTELGEAWRQQYQADRDALGL